MSQAFFYNKKVDVYRLTDDSESPNDTETYAPHITELSCNIQPWDMSYRQDFGGGNIKDFIMYCPVVDIGEKDKIIDGLDEYIITGLKEFNFFGLSHLEVQITKSE